VNGLALDESVDTLTLQSQFSSPPAEFKEAENQWLWLTAANQTVTVRYTVKIPDTATSGTTFQLDGTVSTSSISAETVTGDSSITVRKCVAGSVSGDNSGIDLQEIQQAIHSWATDEEIAGKEITLQKIQGLIDIWATGEAADCQEP